MTVTIDPEIVERMQSIPRELVPNLPDRGVAVTAPYLEVPVISRDARIRGADVESIR